MRDFWRPLALAAAFIVTVVAGSATAQTVTVTKAPPGASVQLVLDTTTVATATSDSAGIASLAVDLASHGGKAETDVRIFVDLCGDVRRVTLVETGYQPAQPNPGCTRREIFGVFYLRQTTTLVVSVAEQSQAVWISQGPAPARWLGNELAGGSAEPTGSALIVPNGLLIFVGGGLGKYGNAVAVSCGVGTECVGKQTRLAGQVGGEFWFSPNIAASVSYLRPANPSTAGNTSSSIFTSSLATNIVVVTGKVGVPFGKTRLYVQGGITYTWATLTTNETIADQTVTVDGVSQTIAGGTATITLKTKGLGWMMSAGSEYWWRPSMALYAEFGRARLGGSAAGGGEGTLDDSVLYAVAGFRFHLVGRR
jgi:hypothetical protein